MRPQHAARGPRGAGRLRRWFPGPGRASRRLRPSLDRLEPRATPAIFPFTVSIPQFHSFDDPDPDPNPFGDDEGDYFALVKIGSNDYQQSSEISVGETLTDANWTFTAPVDTAAGNIVQVQIYLFDDDGFLRFDNDEMDINPNPDALGIVLNVDLTTGRWTGDAPFPAASSSGDGGEGGDTNDRAQIFFDFDIDGDGLNNRWEIAQGIDVDNNGSVDVPLPGASPVRKDLYVEVDAMTTRAPTSLPGITGASSTPGAIVINSASHGLTTGTRVTISGVGGNAAANGTFTVTRLTDNTFSLDGTNGAGAGAYVANTGSWTLAALPANVQATNSTLDLVIDAFNRAPVANPDGSTGISLHVQRDEWSLPFQSWDQDFDGDGQSPYGEDLNADGVLGLGEDVNGNGILDNGDADDQGGGGAFTSFVQAFRQNQFGTPAERGNPALTAAKALAYRYTVFIDRRVESNGNNLGVSVGSSGRGMAGDYFLVSLGNANGGTAMQQAATFMHELGHTLILQHGGGDSFNNKPNYYGNMNYTWQFSTPSNANFDQSWKLDYSAGNLPSLTENALNESAGIGGLANLFTQVGIGLPPGGGGATTTAVVRQGGPVDWSNSDADGNGNRSDDGDLNPPSDTPVSADINFDGAVSTTPFNDFNDWAGIVYDVPTAKGRFPTVFSGGEEVEFTLDAWMNNNRMLFYRTPYGNGQDSLTLRRNGGLIQLVNNANGAVVGSRPLAATGLVWLIGTDNEDDSLTIDFTGGNPIPSGGVFFAGGTGTGTDRLAMTGTPPGAPRYEPDVTGAPENGVLRMGSSTVDFVGLEFVRPVGPRVTSTSLSPSAIDEDRSVTLAASFVDPGSRSTHSVRVDWGDGSPADAFALPPGARSFSLGHRYLDDNPTATPSDLNNVAVTITDDDALAGAGSSSVRVNNVAPQLQNVAVTSIVDENGIATLTGEIVDPGTLDTFTLDVNWGDPLSPNDAETYTFGRSASGRQSFTLTHRYLDDNPTATPQDTYTIALKLADDDTGSDSKALPTLVRNVAPAITAFTSDAVECGDKAEGDTVHVTGAFTDVGTLDTHTARIDWGDHTAPTSAAIVEAGGSGTIAGAHVYTSGGIYRIVITLSDDDTGQGMARTFALITGVGILDGQLQVVGTKQADSVTVNETGNGRFQVHASFIADSPRKLPAAGVTSIAMVLCDGDDRATVAGSIRLPTVIDGEEGNDQLNGGGGPNLLLGGPGDDQIIGGPGQDILVGGTGADRIIGNGGDDILIAGSLGGPADPIDLFDQMLSTLVEWDAFRDRRRTRPRLTIAYDDALDVLTGSAGLDWFFYELGEDRATDEHDGERGS